MTTKKTSKQSTTSKLKLNDGFIEAPSSGKKQHTPIPYDKYIVMLPMAVIIEKGSVPTYDQVMTNIAEIGTYEEYAQAKIFVKKFDKLSEVADYLSSESNIIFVPLDSIDQVGDCDGRLSSAQADYPKQYRL